MRMSTLMRLGAAGLFSLVGLAPLASAADLAAAADTRAGWSGLYLGVFGGYSNVSFDWHETAGLGNYDSSIDTFNGGLFGGYSFAAGPVILGIEGEAGLFSGEANFANVPGPDRIDASPAWQAAIKGRIGYDAGRFMPYVAVGYSWMRLDTTWDVGSSGSDVDASETHQGVMAGIGTDIAITDHAFGRIEYMHTWLSEERYSYCNSGCGADITLGQNALRAGLGYRF